jgi:hypothetical protein
MSWQENVTGEGVPLLYEIGQPVALGRESVSGDRWLPGIETAGSLSTGESQRRASVIGAKKLSAPARRVSKKAIQRQRLYLQLCLNELERAESNIDDPILRSNSLDQVRDHLQVLWELLEGITESEALEEMVSILQIVFCDTSIEALSPSQLRALKSVLVKLAEDPDIDDQTANEMTQELIRGGVDVFREIG